MNFECGTTWIRADFHLHTRADKGRFKYDGEDNRYIKTYINQMKQVGIGLRVITNHNKFDRDEYKALKREANKEGICILPGVELSVNDGANGIHTLIVFDPDEWLVNSSEVDEFKKF